MKRKLHEKIAKGLKNEFEKEIKTDQAVISKKYLVRY
jgi:hypothetical protein